MSVKQWVAVHRKHHAKVETDEDPHSPYVYGINRVLFRGLELYKIEAKTQKTLDDWGHGTPNDWLERVVYSGPGNRRGVELLLVLLILFFGIKGVSLWALQMATIPFLAAGVINGVGHYFGYRNFNTRDGSTNITPFAFIICGEELHNNHHAYPGSAKFSLHWWEFDMGWFYITIFRWLGLIKVHKSIPRLEYDYSKNELDMAALKSVFKARMHVSAEYISSVIEPVLISLSVKESDKKSLSVLQKNLKKDASFSIKSIQETQDEKVIDALSIVNKYPILLKIYNYKHDLEQIWDTKFESQEKLLEAMKSWCKSAKESNVPQLSNFVKMLCAYQVQPEWR